MQVTLSSQGGAHQHAPVWENIPLQLGKLKGLMHSTVSKSPEEESLGVPFLKENCLTVDLAKRNFRYFEGGPSAISAVYSWAALKVPDPLLP